MTITTRAGKGSELTHNEMDTNFTDARDGVALQVPKTKNATGVKIGPNGSADYGWHDLVGTLFSNGTSTYGNFIGTIKKLQFAEGQDASIDFHLPHDYLPGSDIFLHVHWGHNSATCTGGSVTWGFETTYSKGHDQAAFHAVKLITVAQAANTTQYQHMIAETAASVSGGSATQLDTDILETDGLIMCRMYLDSNDLTDSVTVPDPFAFKVDIHYQSTGVGTANKSPDFWT